MQWEHSIKKRQAHPPVEAMAYTSAEHLNQLKH